MVFPNVSSRTLLNPKGEYSIRCFSCEPLFFQWPIHYQYLHLCTLPSMNPKCSASKFAFCDVISVFRTIVFGSDFVLSNFMPLLLLAQRGWCVGCSKARSASSSRRKGAPTREFQPKVISTTSTCELWQLFPNNLQIEPHTLF